MVKKPKTPPRSSSGARLIDAGLKPVQLWLTPEQHDRLKAAAKAEQRKMTQFLIYYGDQAAKKILENSQNNT